MKDLDDAKLEIVRVLEQICKGSDLKQADAEIKTIKAFVETHVSQIKNDPKEEAKREFARGAARKAAESIDLEKAKAIIMDRRFHLLEDEMGMVPIEVELKEAAKVMASAETVEKMIKRVGP